MRTANFRDDVLWAIAYKAGLQPGVDFLQDQADAYASYINAWVRRLYDSADWPEWTIIAQFAPQTAPGVEHVVSWNARPIDYLPPPFGALEPEAPVPGSSVPPLLGKVLKVYLVDPRTTWSPVDTPFRLEHVGVHCGFEHGSSVWIKYIPRAPRFTAKEWDTEVTYKKDALVYSPAAGECYLSKSNGNRGHDPAGLGESGSLEVLTTEITQEFVPANPGLPETAQITDIMAAPPYGMGEAGEPPPLTDPPPPGQVFTITITDDVGTFLGDAVTTADGVMTLDDVFSDLRDQLAAEALLASFTISKLTDPLRIKMENLSKFVVSEATYTAGPGVLPLGVQQLQAYTPAVPAVPATSKAIKLSIATQEVIPGTTYQLTFTSLDSAEHPVVYVSKGTDDALQILAGLVNAITELQGADPFFTNIQSAVDTLGPSVTFSIAPTIAKVSLNATTVPPGSIWWTYVPFPLALVDQVVRGAYADALKEQGQPDKAAPEEQAVATEQTVRTAAFASKQYDGLTDQQVPRSRYAKQ